MGAREERSAHEGILTFMWLAHRLVEEERGRNRLLELFAKVMSRGGCFDSDWKYVLSVQQLVHSMYPQGFPDMGAVEVFLIRHFYPDLPRRGEVHIAHCILYAWGRRSA